MRRVERILVIQTAFLGDVILTLPLIQVIKDFFSPAEVDVVVVPRSSDLLHNHPSIGAVIEYDKKGRDRGFKGLTALSKALRERHYDVAFIPHRSLRSALLPLLAGIPIRIGFKKGFGRVLHSKRATYDKDIHEIDRNLSLLEAIGIRDHGRVLPNLYPSESDKDAVDGLLSQAGIRDNRSWIAVAPGTVWFTKRWLKERYTELAGALAGEGMSVLLVGGPDDEVLCEQIREGAGSSDVQSFAGRLTLLQSAELIRRCKALVCNDSAPLHVGVSVRTPVVAIFGATVPSFGFGPLGEHDSVVETRGLRCRPCSIHGGDTCPIKTFECMTAISAQRVLARVISTIERVSGHAPS